MTHPNVQGRCPVCGGSLFLGDGGWVTCSRSDCADPAAPSKALGVPTPAEGLTQGEREAAQAMHDAIGLWRVEEMGPAACAWRVAVNTARDRATSARAATAANPPGIPDGSTPSPARAPERTEPRRPLFDIVAERCEPAIDKVDCATWDGAYGAHQRISALIRVLDEERAVSPGEARAEGGEGGR